MPVLKNTIIASAPARICLMGEHQDYYGLASITAAINLRINLLAESRTDRKLCLDLPDINRKDTIHLDREIRYTGPSDYVRSALNVIRRRGLNLPTGFDVRITSDIPIAKGISSS